LVGKDPRIDEKKLDQILRGGTPPLRFGLIILSLKVDQNEFLERGEKWFLATSECSQNKRRKTHLAKKTPRALIDPDIFLLISVITITGIDRFGV
jgi:hypothetical protein